MSESQTVPHPGEILAKEFLSAHSISQYRVAVDIGVPPRRINEIVHGKRGVTADTALRLARYFDNDPMYWLQLQARWDLQRAKGRLGSRLIEEVRIPSRSQSVKAQPDKAQPNKAQPDKRLGEHRPAPQPPAEQSAPQPNLADHLL